MIQKIAVSDRRRLSTIFHRETPDTSDRGLKMNGSNCQSPRAQRCWRDASTG
jgi:hypothetical protein